MEALKTKERENRVQEEDKERGREHEPRKKTGKNRTGDKEI